MPLFGRHSAETTRTPPQTTTTTSHSSSSRGLFGKRSTTPEQVTTTSRSGGSRFFHRSEDPSITAARQRVAGAEAAERDADQARFQARAAVRNAREQVKVLEKEAAEEARLAKIKQNQAHSISKRAKPLGRKWKTLASGVVLY
ncbi:hypothetical protein MMC34_001322 [Xylographa carneopallida]|nr:hypothetical protein [Xylographa carneopallida]